jgi:hypothetical protein
MAAVAVLLLAGCLFAGQESIQSVAPAGVISSAGLMPMADQGRPGSLSPEGLGIMFDNDVGVSDIIWPSDYAGFGDRIFPRGRVANLGLLTQVDIAVVFVIYDSAAGARVYGPETVEVARLDSGEVRTVTFPYWDAPAEERVYFDTMMTVLQGDEDTTNDWKAGRFSVAVWGERHLTYNDGETGPNGCWSWTQPNYSIGVRFPGPCPVTQIAVGLNGHIGSYPCTCKVRLNDGPDGMPGTEIWASPLMLYTAGSPYDYINYVVLDPPAVVTSDSFYVTWKPQEVGDPFPSFDWDEPIQSGNDFSTMPGSETWGSFVIGPENDANGDLVIDAYCGGAVLDGSPKGIAAPQGQFDSITTFVPQVVVMNAGLLGRDDIMTKFFITGPSDDGDTIYAGTANTGPIQSCETRTVSFADSVTLATGNYTMTGITLLPYDGRRGNDTLVRPLSVGLGIADVKAVPGRSSVSVVPNPLGEYATVRCNPPKAGPVTLDVFDVTGRTVLNQTFVAGSTGTTSLDLRKLEAGVYMVKVKADGFTSTQKLVVQHR